VKIFIYTTIQCAAPISY